MSPRKRYFTTSFRDLSGRHTTGNGEQAMKHSPEMRRIIQRMARGVFSRDGFLGTDPRPLEEILDADNSEVVGLGTTHEILAEKLEQIYLGAKSGFGTVVQVGDSLSAVFRETMGRIPCPWGACGTFPKGEIELRDAEAGEKVVFTPLSVHMISAHGFYPFGAALNSLAPGFIERDGGWVIVAFA
ncbi:MAG: hypothetical protein QGD94_10980, partial [Planctomycetia bacterium]|nr:hypothetical protein [Planctomycetia bacterium]